MLSANKNLLGHAAYLLALAIFATLLPPSLWDHQSRNYILIIGYIALWRYSFWAVNLSRFLIYEKIVFPRWRAYIERHQKELMPSHVYLMVTSFRIDTHTTRLVYTSCIEEALHFNKTHRIPVTIVASIVEKADEVMIKHILARFPVSEGIKLIITRISGTGKRDALAYGFRAISKLCPAPDAVVAVIDGDSLLEKGLIEKCVPLFKLHPNLGALTTDEICEVQGDKKFRDWYSMRFAQRHIYMSSVSLSKRVLTLTGRMSMFRADILCDPVFIERVEMDWIDHWRLKRFKFLTGDDKSSWYHLLKNGYEMLYVPDVKVLTIETPPHPSFIRSSFVLMRRWFGNMLRTSDRAIKLGPRVMGWFPWISIIDQRLSMWTALTGLTVTIIAWLAGIEYAFVFYFFWMMLTRYILVLSFLLSRPTVSATYAFYLYYNQIVGSFIKTYVLFRLDKQKWTRQNTTLSQERSAWAEKLVGFSSLYMHMVAYGTFILLLTYLTDTLSPPDLNYWAQIIRETARRDLT